MSTRAIIGIMNGDGTISAAWQWNDGGDILDNLNKCFDTKEKALLLISHKVWNSMLNDDELKEYEKCLKELKLKNSCDYVNVCGVTLLKRSDRNSEEPNGGKYSDLKDALGQDINFVYLFDEKNGSWKRYE